MDKEYIKSQELWIKQQILIIQELKANIDNHKKMIEIYEKGLNICLEALHHENKQLERQKQVLKEYYNG